MARRSPESMVKRAREQALREKRELKQSKKDARAAARKAGEGEDPAAIRSAIEGLTRASHKLAEMLYQKTAAPGGSPGPTDGQGPGDVVDAEYTAKN